MPVSYRYAPLGAMFVAVALLACGPAWADFPGLIRRVPAEANAIVVIDADRLFASPMAQRDGWKKKQVAEFADRPLAVPPRAIKAVRAARLDLQAGNPEWELMLVELNSPPTLDEIARREKGYVDQIANTKAVWSPRGAYVVSVGQDALGVLFPPNRQFLARWLKQPRGKISDYLLDAAQSISATDAQVLLALDLEDAVEPQRVQGVLTRIGGTKSDPKAMAKALASLRGVKFEVIIKDKPWGRLMLEFADDPAVLVPVARPLVIDALEHFGAALDDLRTWKVDHSVHNISLHGELSSSGLLRLGSLLELPSLDLDQAEESVDASNPMVYATQNHFMAVSKLLDDLLAQKRDAKTYGQLATWIEQYAKRIDRLPLVNVDPDMQQYSAGVAEDLRQIASSMKGAGIRTGMQTAGLDSTSYGWGNYDGYFGNREVDNQRRAVRAQERGTSNLDSGKLADQIRADTSNMRRLMTQRYKVEF